MKLRKDMRALSLLLVIALVGAIFVPVVSAVEDLSQLKSTITQSTSAPTPTTLNAGIDEDTWYREALLEYRYLLNSSYSELDESDKLITLIDQVLSKKSISYEDFYDVYQIVYPYINPDVQDERWGSIHGDMAYDAGNYWGLSSSQKDILRNSATDPDHEFIDGPDWGPVNSFDHYRLIPIWNAPDVCEKLALEAIDYINNNNDAEGYEKLSHSLHFMSDMGVPYHDLPTELLRHADYEVYVQSNWDSDHNYESIMNNFGSYYYITDVQSSAYNLNAVTSGYKSYISDAMGSPGWGDDPTVVSYTENCIGYTTGYNRGLVKYVMDRT
ncbi:MAG: hypothetical protein WC346_09860 [Methanogenium sp.]|jgi:hypothetical protein